jgi:hypothetical protein
MPYKGIIKGKTIELEDPLPYPEGQPVSVSVVPLAPHLQPGSPAAIRQVMHEPPHLQEADVHILERAMEEGKLPVEQGNVFFNTEEHP